MPGQYYDAETGLTYNNQRYMNTGWGRFAQADPIGLAGAGIGAVNLYSYAGNNPLNNIDPTGNDIVGQTVGTWAGRSLGCVLGEIPDPLGGCFPGGIIGGTLGGQLGDNVGDIISQMSQGSGESQSLQSQSLQSQIEKIANNREYKNICNEPTPPGLTDPCERAKWDLNKAQRCKQARKAFTDKWHSGVDDIHDEQLYNDIDAQISNAQARVKRLCQCLK